MTGRRVGMAAQGSTRPATRGAPARIRTAVVDLGRCQLLSLAAFAVSGAGCLVIGALLLLPVGAGFLLLPPAATALRRMSDRYRRWAAAWTETGPGTRSGARSRTRARTRTGAGTWAGTGEGTVISPPHPLPPRHAGRGGRRRQTLAILGDAGFWHDLRWAWAEPWTGALLAAVPLALVEYGLFGTVVQPFVWRLLGDGNWYAFVLVDSTPSMLAALLLGLGFTAAGLRLAPVVLRLHARWSRRLLAAPYTTELVRRIEHLAGSRADVLDVQAAELRRIERDLHDGAQARLVSLGMTLDEATRLLDHDPQAARALLQEVRATSQRALQDLRELVHGVLPPVLADRGLGDAVRSLALDSHLDVHVEAALPGRLPAPVESAGYFAVAELLANAAKHSGAPEVRIDLRHADGALRVTVADDGRGGADPDGSGLRGLRRRLAPFDGTLVLHSPPGGPTTATLEIPCASSSPKTSSSSGTG